MKKALLIAAAILLFAGSINAAPAQGYIAIFNDANHSVCSVSPLLQYVPFDVWIWCLPGVNGMIAAEFRVIFPATVITTATTPNPLITVALGDLVGGISVAYGACNQDWTYTHHLTCMALAAVPGFIEIGANPSAGAYQFATCELGYPIEPIQYLNGLALGQLCVVGTQESTWGAIKNLF